MANNRLDKVYLSKTQLNNIANGDTITSGSDTYTADETALYLVDEELDTTPTNNSENPITSGGVYTALLDYGATIDLEVNSSTYVVTATLKNSAGTTLSTDTIDLPLESVVVSGSYDDSTKKVILTLQSGSTVEFSVADLVSGLQSEITSSNKLSSDLVDDTNNTHKFVSSTDITNWNSLVSNVQADWDATSGLAEILHKPTIPTVNNNTITIKNNGNTVDTFTLNQSSNKTIDITNIIGASTSADAVDLSTLGYGYYTWKSNTYFKLKTTTYYNNTNYDAYIIFTIGTVKTGGTLASYHYQFITNYDFGTTNPTNLVNPHIEGFFTSDGARNITYSGRNIMLGRINGNLDNNVWGQGIYAPTDAGTSGQYLKSSGSGAPTWDNLPTYESKSASQGGTDTSLVTTGEKYTWNNKSDFSGSYNDLTDKPTIPTVNNATLTIQKNSTTVDTFTANASSDKTINITVPTKVSDLTNDSGFISSYNNQKVKTPTVTFGDNDTVEIIAGSNVSIAGNASAKTIEISATDTTYNTINNNYDASTNKLATANDISGFITKSVNDLTNYYLKTDTYTKTEVNNLIGGIETINYEIVSTLPTASSSTYFNDSKIVYMLAMSNGSGNDYYDEYVTIRTGTEGSYTYSWEKIGNTQVDLTNYSLKSETVSDVTYDSTNKKIQKTINGTTTDVVAFGANAFTDTAIPTSYVSSVNGSTGAITNIATTNTDQTISGNKTFTGDISTNAKSSIWNGNIYGKLNGSYNVASIGFNTGGQVGFQSNADTAEDASNAIAGFAFRMGSDTRVQMFNDTMRPVNSNQYSLGTSSKQFDNIYGKTLYQDGVQVTTTSENASSGGTTKSLVTTGEKYIWNNKSDFSGSYNDLTDKPTIPTKDSDLTTNDRYVRYDTDLQNLSSTQKSNVRTNIGAGTSNFSGSYLDLSNKPTIPSVTLNGSVNTVPSFYAPTTAGTSGYFLKSNGSGAPTWVAITQSDITSTDVSITEVD